MLTNQLNSSSAITASKAAVADLRSRVTPRRVAAGIRDCLLGLPAWCRYRLTKPRTILVLGMHRSGTSWLTRVVNLSGASLGGAVAGPNPWNQTGHWESVDGILINDLILSLSGGAWDQPPDHFYCDGLLRWKMKRFLGRLHGDGTAIWKDPRTVLTFPLWKPLLHRHSILAIFRHPMSVAQSLQRRDGFSLEKGVELWCRYNESLLTLCAQEKEVYWCDFDLGPEHVVEVVQRLGKRVGLNVNQQAADSYRPNLRTSDAREDPASERGRNLYARLKRQITQHAGECVPGA
jgi:hypothetical protein